MRDEGIHDLRAPQRNLQARETVAMQHAEPVRFHLQEAPQQLQRFLPAGLRQLPQTLFLAVQYFFRLCFHNLSIVAAIRTNYYGIERISDLFLWADGI